MKCDNCEYAREIDIEYCIECEKLDKEVCADIERVNKLRGIKIIPDYKLMDY